MPALHGAEHAKNMNRNNRPTEAHRAPFYLAIVRLPRPPLPPALSTARQGTIGCDTAQDRSWLVPGGVPYDEQLLRLRGDNHLWRRRDG